LLSVARTGVLPVLGQAAHGVGKLLDPAICRGSLQHGRDAPGVGLHPGRRLAMRKIERLWRAFRRDVTPAILEFDKIGAFR
jgi:hypothetical protein